MECAGHYPLLAWKRPESEDFPKIWHSFKVHDIHSDKLIEYSIQDLPQDRVGDFYQHLIESFVPDEPVGQAHGYQNDPLVLEDYRRFWAPIIAQRTALVCFKAGSKEIVGGNLVYISSRGDTYPREMRHELKSSLAIGMSELADILYEHHDTFEAYGVDKYMASVALSVDRRYRGHGIGNHFLASKKAMCRAFGVKLTQSIYTSDFSSAIADKAGYKTDVAISYADMVKRDPKFGKLANIKSKQISLKSLAM